MHTGVFMKAFHQRTSTSGWAGILAAAALLAGGIVARAQAPRPMAIVDLLNVPRLTEPRLSPDGREVVYARADADWKSGKRLTHIWRARVAGGDPIQLTNGAEGESS